ncbi:Nitrilase/cyanide hydratase and apolipo protein n-acyltransferase-like protein [Globisporangium polare]
MLTSHLLRSRKRVIRAVSSLIRHHQSRREPLRLAQVPDRRGRRQAEEHRDRHCCDRRGRGAQVVPLPECWNSPYATSTFPLYAEEIPATKALLRESEHPSTFALSQLAQQHKIYLVGGSIPEKEGGHVYNTSVIFSPLGEILGKHRKVHLFDNDVPNRMTFKESDTLSVGNAVTIFDTPYCKIGVGICYDIRFPELSMLMKKQGVKVLIFPSAFNLTTGPAHWERADTKRGATRPSPRHGDEAIAYAEIDLEVVEELRRDIPMCSQTRSDHYELVQK